MPDTDWHVARLYAFAHEHGASLLAPTWSRYVVDRNRPPDDVSLYPATGLYPLTGFDGAPVYLDGEAPGPAEIAERALSRMAVANTASIAAPANAPAVGPASRRTSRNPAPASTAPQNR